MDPYPDGYNLFSHIPKPHEMELQLIATAHPYFKAYILLGTGDHAYKGHVCNIEQYITTFFLQLPPKITEMPHCIVRKESGNKPNNREYQDFKLEER